MRSNKQGITINFLLNQRQVALKATGPRRTCRAPACPVVLWIGTGVGLPGLQHLLPNTGARAGAGTAISGGVITAAPDIRCCYGCFAPPPATVLAAAQSSGFVVVLIERSAGGGASGSGLAFCCMGSFFHTLSSPSSRGAS